jgi:hypothetical protein
MGTAPANFPPDPLMPVGAVQTGNLLALSASQALTVMFTAPISGLYLISAAFQVVSTNAAGTLVSTVTTPNAGTLAVAGTAPAVVKDLLTSGGGVDGYMQATPIWLNAGAQVKYSSVAAGLTGTVYNVFLSAQRLF